MDWLSSLISSSVPFIIPAFLLASFLVGHKTPKNGESRRPKAEAKPDDSGKPPTKKATDKDMTSS